MPNPEFSNFVPKESRRVDSPDPRKNSTQKPRGLDRRSFLRGSVAAATAAVFAVPERAVAGNALLSKGGELQQYKRADGSVEYKHSDPETTHILGVMSGAETLNYNDRLALLQAEIVELCMSDPNKKFLGKNIEQWNGSQSKEIILAILQTRHPRIKNKFIFDAISENPDLALKLLVPWVNLPLDKQLQSSLWEIEKKANNPKLNWAKNPTAGSGFMARVYSGIGKGLLTLDGALYAPASNTLYISKLNLENWLWAGKNSLGEVGRIVKSEEKQRADETIEKIKTRLEAQISLKDRVEQGLWEALVEADKEAEDIDDLTYGKVYGQKINDFEKSRRENLSLLEINNFIDKIKCDPGNQAAYSTEKEVLKKLLKQKLNNKLTKFTAFLKL